MSTEALPISASAFAEAIKELPLSAVYGKVSELRNSIGHLMRSNEELRSFIRESEDGPDSPDNKELENYILENEVVMQSMAERIALLKAEVDERGQLWIEEGPEDDNEQDDAVDGEVEREVTPLPINGSRTPHDNGDVPHTSNLMNGSRTPLDWQEEEQPDDDGQGIHL
jgi:hypothetical protein